MPIKRPSSRAFFCSSRSCCVAGDLLRLVERCFVVATVVIETSRSVERKLVWRRKVLATHFRRIHAEFSGNEIERAFHDVGRFRPARAAISVGGHLVREAAR